MRFVLAAVVAVLLVGLAPAATAQPDQSLARIDVTEVTPSVVRSGSPPELTVSGTLTNTGDRTIGGLEMRVQRGAPRATEASVREALAGNATTMARSRFTEIAGPIAPGQRLPFTLRIPITGGPDSLQITRPGVYPLLLNVNGDPAGSSRARVAETHFMLPVLSPPGAAPETPEQPTPITMLVPLVDYPRMERGSTPGRPAVLIDDGLSRSLAPGGRLFEVVDAVGKEAGAGSPLGSGLCFAIDPDLIATAQAMVDGYRVRQDDGSTRPGSGSGAAKLWLSKLRDITQGRCVIALPYSDADIVALGRAGLPDLVKGALDGAGIVQRVLGVEPRRDVLWPIGGALDEPAASQLSGMGIDTLLMHPESLALPQEQLRPVRVRTQDSGYTPTAQPIDPLLAATLNPLRDGSSDSTGLSPSGDATLSTQDTLGALTFRATLGSGSGATSVLAPPRRWQLGGQDMRKLLSGMKTLTEAGYVQPTGLPSPDGSSEGESRPTGSGEQAPSGSRPTPAPETTSAPASPAAQGSEGTAPQEAQQEPPAAEEPPAVALTYPVPPATNEIRQDVLDELAGQNYKVGELYRAAERDPALNIDPAELTTPLRNGLLRGASSAWRGDPAASRYWVDQATETLENVLSRVQVEEFGGQISLTSSSSPIPVTVTNKLPVTVGVNLHVDSPPGIEVNDLGLLKIPANGSRQFWLDTEVNRSGKFSVDVTVRTEGGTRFGPTRRIQLESNAYGTMPLLITVIGAALLVLLSARRLVRRARANRDPRDEEASNTETPQTEDRGTEIPQEASRQSSQQENRQEGRADTASGGDNPDAPGTEHRATTESDRNGD